MTEVDERGDQSFGGSSNEVYHARVLDPARRHAEILAEITEAVARGQPPWENRVALQGPCLLARSRSRLRGLSAVVGWHVGLTWPNRPLAWRLVAQNEAPEIAPVFELSANGGHGYYAAIPESRPNRLLDGPPPWLSKHLSVRLLTESLRNARSSMSLPDVDPDEALIVSLSLAFLRPLGGAPRYACAFEGSKLTPSGLRRATAWAQWLADDLIVRGERLRFFIDGLESEDAPDDSNETPEQRAFRSLRRSGATPHALMRPHFLKRLPRSERTHLLSKDWEVRTEGLRSNQTFANSFPSEIRVRAPEREGHLSPELPIRASILNPRWRVRVPSVGRLSPYLQPEPIAILSDLGWPDHALLGLSLSETLQLQIGSSEPALLWRRLGRRFCQAANRFDYEFGTRILRYSVALVWKKLVAYFRSRSWLRADTTMRLGELRGSPSWDIEALEQWVHSWAPGSSLAAAAGSVRVREIPSLVLSGLQRRPEVDAREHAIRDVLAEVLGCTSTWQAIQLAAREGAWERHARRKASGGVRWLDIPPPRLRHAQAVVSRLLLSRTPRAGSPTAYVPGGCPALHARVHAGAIVAVKVDIEDFFGSVRLRHVAPWLGMTQGRDRDILSDWSVEAKESILALVFHVRGGVSFLPQGSPCSPPASNLAAVWLDEAIVSRGAAILGSGRFSYSRYADDLVLSTREPIPNFAALATDLLQEEVRRQGWSINPHKTKIWAATDREPLHLCGLKVPRQPTGRVELDNQTARAARAALHQLRHRLELEANGDASRAHGMVSYAYSATGDLRWLAYTSRHVLELARRLAGPIFSESFLAGWSDAAE